MTSIEIIAQTIRAIVRLSDDPLGRLERLAAEHQQSIFRESSSPLYPSDEYLHFISDNFCEALKVIWIEYGGDPGEIPRLTNLAGNFRGGGSFEE